MKLALLYGISEIKIDSFSKMDCFNLSFQNKLIERSYRTLKKQTLKSLMIVSSSQISTMFLGPDGSIHDHVDNVSDQAMAENNG
jgi:hypothetical protein